MQENWVWSLGWEGPLVKEMTSPYSIFAWEISWTEESGWLQSMGSQSVRHDWCDLACIHAKFVNVCFTINAKIYLNFLKKKWIKNISSKRSVTYGQLLLPVVCLWVHLCVQKPRVYKSHHHFMNIFIYSNLWKLFLHIFHGLRLVHFSEINI